jgi:DNA-binding LytR/AlgR family response regulator
MPGLTGIEAAKEIAQLDLGDDALLPEMVFITAYDQYAIDAFEQGVVDYVLKPAEPERLKLTADRLKTRLMQRANDLSGHVMGDVSAETKVLTANNSLATHSVQQLLMLVATS